MFKYSTTGLMLAIVAVVALVWLTAPAPAAPAEEVHEGKVVAVTKDTLTVLDNRDDDNDAFVVSGETKITRNGKPASLKEIEVGDLAKVTARPMGEKLLALTIQAKAPQ